MRTLILSALLTFSSCLFASNPDELTQMLHDEAALLKSSILQESSCPTLYTLLSQLTSKGGISMPKSIVIFNTEYQKPTSRTFMLEDIVIQTIPISVSFDFLGDLVICRDILTQFTYHELEGILATAVAEKANRKITKQALAALGVVATAFAATGLWELYHFPHAQDFLNPAAGYALTIPAFLASSAVSKHVQKTSDISALSLTDAENVRAGLFALARLQNNYCSSSTTERIFAAFNLEKIYKTIVNTCSDDNTVNARLDNLDMHIS